MAAPDAQSLEEEMERVKRDIKEVKEKIEQKEGEIKEAKKEGYADETEYKSAKEDLALEKRILVELLKEKNLVEEKLLRSQGGAGPGPGSEEPAPATVQLFWQSLLSSKCISADGRLLELPDSAFFMGNSLSGSRMVIRRAYETLFDTIKSMFKDGLRRWVITGTPGIGKTYFKFPLMHWLIKEKMAERILLQMQGRRYLFSEGADVRLGSEQAFEAELNKPSTWWIVDMSRAFEREAPTIVLSWPSKQNYSEFLKLQGSTKLYMDLWSDEEMEMCRTTCFPNVSLQLMETLQRKWGNVPRYVLEKAYDKAAQASLEDALCTCAWADIHRCIGEPDSGPEASHKIVHLSALPGHCEKLMMIASPYVAKKLAARAANEHSDWLQRLVTLSMGEPAYRAAAGTMFEAYAHRRLQAGGEFQVRKLGAAPSAAEHLTIPLATEVLVFRRPEDVLKAAEDVYCLPRVHNFPAVDALVQPSSLFQMTIAQKRDINSEGLDKVKQHLRARPVRLYFCVPGGLYDKFSEVHGVASDVEQWALQVPGFS